MKSSQAKQVKSRPVKSSQVNSSHITSRQVTSRHVTATLPNPRGRTGRPPTTPGSSEFVHAAPCATALHAWRCIVNPCGTSRCAPVPLWGSASRALCSHSRLARSVLAPPGPARLSLRRSDWRWLSDVRHLLAADVINRRASAPRRRSAGEVLGHPRAAVRAAADLCAARILFVIWALAV